jgi:hypothetical protein
LTNYASDGGCFICGKAVNGIFNSAVKIENRKKTKRDGNEEGKRISKEDEEVIDEYVKKDKEKEIKKY